MTTTGAVTGVTIMHDGDHGDTGHVIAGNSSAEKLTGGTGNDVIHGEGGNDVLVGGGGHDKLYGGTGSDSLTSYGRGGQLCGNAGDDLMVARKTGYGQYHHYGMAGDDTLVMDLANQKGWGHTGHHAYGGEGHDSFVFQGLSSLKEDQLGRIDDFNPGQDSLWIDGRRIDPHNLPSNMRIVSYNGQQWLHINNDTSRGNADPNKGDALYALDGARQLPGGEEVHFTPFPENVDALPTVAFVNQNHVPYTLYASREASMNKIASSSGDIDGTSGADYITGLKDTHIKSGITGVIDGFGGHDVIDAAYGHDTVRGGDGADLVSGGLDNDVLYGGHGDDRLYGGSENDRLFGESGDDAVFGGTGNDVLKGDAGHDSLTGGDGRDGLYGGSGNDLLAGNDGDDVIRGGKGGDVVAGGAGADVFVFAAGDMVDWDLLEGTHDQRHDQLDRVGSTAATSGPAQFVPGVDTIKFVGHPAIDGLSDLKIWATTIDGNKHFVIQVADTNERILVDVADTVTWADMHQGDNFIFA